MENTLDRGVTTILNGLDLDKHAPLLLKHNINLDIFLSLNVDDLKIIGIEDKEEIDLLIKYIKKFRKSNKWQELKPLEFEELSQILDNTEKHLHSVNVASNFIKKKMRKGKPLDILVHEDTAASSAIAILCERIQDENRVTIEDIDRIIREIKGKKENRISLRKITVSFAIAVALLSTLIAVSSYGRKS